MDTLEYFQRNPMNNTPISFSTTMDRSERVGKALVVASVAHMGQTRKYTGEAYITHPIEVASIVSSITSDQEMIIAALLHDVVEDTSHTIEDIRRDFGEAVASLVSDLTDVSVPEDGNRSVRKAIDLEHTAQASQRAHTIKLADLISNTKSIVQHDPGFARIYMLEKRALLEVLVDGDPDLYNQAKTIVDDYFGGVGTNG